MTSYVLSEELKQKHAPLIYDLYAVSNHVGNLMYGHYTAYCKNLLTEKWYNYNDASVSLLDSTSEIVSSAAYVLYYKRRDFYPNINEINYQAIKVTPEKLEIDSENNV